MVVRETTRVQEPPALPRGCNHTVITQEAAATTLEREKREQKRGLSTEHSQAQGTRTFWGRGTQSRKDLGDDTCGVLEPGWGQ